jgi:tripartite-type tricarboxylate transporter receptor subunit TctC
MSVRSRGTGSNTGRIYVGKSIRTTEYIHGHQPFEILGFDYGYGHAETQYLLNLSSIEAHEKTGKVRILAAAGAKRAVLRPDLPTVAEAGVPGFSTTAWFALWGPANMAPNLVKTIHADVGKVLELPQSWEFFQTNSFERVDLTPEQFAQLIQDDSKHWGTLIKAVGAKLD